MNEGHRGVCAASQFAARACNVFCLTHKHSLITHTHTARQGKDVKALCWMALES